MVGWRPKGVGAGVSGRVSRPTGEAGRDRATRAERGFKHQMLERGHFPDGARSKTPAEWRLRPKLAARRRPSFALLDPTTLSEQHSSPHLASESRQPSTSRSSCSPTDRTRHRRRCRHYRLGPLHRRCRPSAPRPPCRWQVIVPSCHQRRRPSRRSTTAPTCPHLSVRQPHPRPQQPLHSSLTCSQRQARRRRSPASGPSPTRAARSTRPGRAGASSSASP